jgi:hypothetical protein
MLWAVGRILIRSPNVADKTVSTPYLGMRNKFRATKLQIAKLAKVLNLLKS